MDDLWATKNEDVGLIVRAISFQDFQPMWSWSTNVTDRWTDRRHVIARPHFAVCTIAHHAVKLTEIIEIYMLVMNEMIKYRIPPEHIGPKMTSTFSIWSSFSVFSIPPFGYGKHELRMKVKLHHTHIDVIMNKKAVLSQRCPRDAQSDNPHMVWN